MSTLSTHILDVSTGQPAQGVRVTLARDGAAIAHGVTDEHGRIGALNDGPLTVGNYRLTAAIGDWFAARGRENAEPFRPPLGEPASSGVLPIR